MGQIEIFTLMTKYRLVGDHDYKTPNEVYKDLKQNGHQIPNVASKLATLAKFGYLEAKEVGMWRMAYRARMNVARSVGKKEQRIQRIT